MNIAQNNSYENQKVPPQWMNEYSGGKLIMFLTHMTHYPPEWNISTLCEQENVLTAEITHKKKYVAWSFIHSKSLFQIGKLSERRRGRVKEIEGWREGEMKKGSEGWVEEDEKQKWRERGKCREGFCWQTGLPHCQQSAMWPGTGCLLWISFCKTLFCSAMPAFCSHWCTEGFACVFRPLWFIMWEIWL